MSLNIARFFKKKNNTIRDLYSLGVDITEQRSHVGKKDELRTKKVSKQTSPNIFSHFSLAKRQKILITSFLVFFGFIFITQTANIVFKRYYTIFILASITYILSIWSLWQGMTRVKAIMLMILPFLYCIAVHHFTFCFLLGG